MSVNCWLKPHSEALWQANNSLVWKKTRPVLSAAQVSVKQTVNNLFILLLDDMTFFL